MNKKLILSLIVITTFLCIPIQQGQAPTYEYDFSDIEGDVREVINGTPGAIVTYPSCDIRGTHKIDTEVALSLYGTPQIDDKHYYNLTMYWDISYYNYSMCLAGAAIHTVPLKNGGSAQLFNGTYTIIRHANNTILATALEADLILPIVGNNITFELNSSSLLTPISKSYTFIFASLYEYAAVASAQHSVISPKLPESKYDCWICDTAGSGFCWIPFPDDCGGIETPIIIGIVGSSFIFIQVIRRRKRK